MKKYEKIYVLAPYKYATGGIELAHQLVDYLNTNNQNAYVVYVKKGMEISSDLSVTSEYKKYNIRLAYMIEDSKNNIMILPEIYFDFIFKYSEIQIGCWWMSVDNHYSTSCFGDMLKFSGFTWEKKLKLIYHYCIKRDGCFNKNSIKAIKKEEKRIFHFYQSCYAQYHLYSLGMSKVLPLSDYINNDLLGNGDIENIKRKDIVLYNPAKGINFTHKIINMMPHIQFVALKGLTHGQLKKYMQEAKVYIDFGHFPGKDRLPREAVYNGCCIITSKLGAAAFYEDIPILEKYKFERKNSNLRLIVKCIDDVISDYENCHRDFDFFRQSILCEKEIFFYEINCFFGLV